MRQLENRAASLPKLITETQQKRVDAETTIAEVDARIDDPFKHSADLREAQERQARVQAGLAAMATEQNPAAETSHAQGADRVAVARDRVKALAARARAQVGHQPDLDPVAGAGPISNRPPV